MAGYLKPVYVTIPGQKELVGYDDYGDPIYHKVDKEVKVHSVQPSAVTEETGNVRWSSTTLDVFSTFDLGVTPKDKVRYQGKEYQVEGPSSDFSNPWTHRVFFRQQIKRTGAGNDG